MLPGPHDVPAGRLALPWDAQLDFVVGEFARKRGVNSQTVWFIRQILAVPQRGGRMDSILPGTVLRTPADFAVEASAAFLRHLRDAWNTRWRGRSRGLLRSPGHLPDRACILRCRARELTVKAALCGRSRTYNPPRRAPSPFYAGSRRKRSGGERPCMLANPSWSSMWRLAHRSEPHSGDGRRRGMTLGEWRLVTTSSWAAITWT